ncbi:MAG: hypothetical protein IPL49_17775 [Saprospirales bacterium]|nr:hypothetical protein [Saprospirales bacterium]
MTPNNEKMGFNATWSMAVGGMVGGGIFSVLGVHTRGQSAPWIGARGPDRPDLGAQQCVVI